MTDLASFRIRVLDILGNATVTRFANDILDEGLRSALTEFSNALPNVITAAEVVATTGREQTLSILDAKQILNVAYPYDVTDQTLNLQYSWYAYRSNDTHVIQFSGDIIPQAGETMLITYAAPHSIDNLDSAVGTTVNDQYDTLLANGAAGFCAVMRASQVGESFRTQDYARMQDWGLKSIAAFRATLARIRMDNTYAIPVPQSGWRMDRKDGERY